MLIEISCHLIVVILVVIEISPVDSIICSTSVFKCRSDHKYVPLNQRCDSKNDCLDGSDEEYIEGIGCDDIYPRVSGLGPYLEGQNVTVICQNRYVSGWTGPTSSRSLEWCEDEYGILSIVDLRVEDSRGWECEEMKSDYIVPSEWTDIEVIRIINNSPISEFRVVVCPEYSEIVGGGTATFFCSTNIPNARREWVFQHGIRPAGAEVTGIKFQIHNADCRDTGIYTCRVWNSSGTVLEQSVVLNVVNCTGTDFETSSYSKISPKCSNYILMLILYLLNVKFMIEHDLKI